jgi:hypothetical protein
MAEDYDLESEDGVIIMTLAVQDICPDYESIIGEVIEENN